MNYSLNIGEWNSVFAVPSSVVDRYIMLAGGNALKLLLYLLRHGGKEFSEEKLRTELGFAEAGELEDAALFWIQRGIIRYSDEKDGVLAAKASDEKLLSAEDNAAAEDKKSESDSVPRPDDVYIQQTLPIENTPKPEKPARTTPANVDSREIASRINTDPEIQMLFTEAEKIYGRQLRPRDNQTIISLVDHYGLPAGVALMLLSYCFKVQKTTPNYILSAASGWAEEGVDSIEKADARILFLERQNGFERRLREALDMNAGLTPQQKKYLAIWTDEWKFSEEMIILACQNTVDQIGKWNVKYTNKILEDWKQKGISTPETANAPRTPKQPVLQAPRRSSSINTNDVVSKIRNRYKS